MRTIVYYVAVSIDGFIAGPEEDISGFVQSGPSIDQYLADLKDFDTVIMGRKTYEFGYQFGLKPGTPAYPHMEHYIVSESLQFDDPHPKVHLMSPNLDQIKALKAEAGGPIYLCGGSVLAGWLLENGLIDEVKIKLNPFIQGNGTPLFANITKAHQLQLRAHQSYPSGLQIITYQIQYN